MNRRRLLIILLVILLILFLTGNLRGLTADAGETTPTSTIERVMSVGELPDPFVTYLPAVRISPPTTIATTTTSTQPVAPTVAALLPAPKYSSWPSWRTTAEGVPYYSGRPACSPVQAQTIAVQFVNRGASVDTARWAIYVASRESGCNYLATNVNAATGDDSHCAFQLNARSGGPLSPAGVLGRLGWTKYSVKASLSACAAAAGDLWAICGKGPWIQGDYGCRKPTS